MSAIYWLGILRTIMQMYMPSPNKYDNKFMDLIMWWRECACFSVLIKRIPYNIFPSQFDIFPYILSISESKLWNNQN